MTRLNVGNAMNAATGIFTAPKPGTYFFSFSGRGVSNSFILPRLFLNDNVIGTGCSDTVSGDSPTFTLQSTLQLNAGDQVSLKFSNGRNGYLYDNGDHFTHFTGWLLQENLVLNPSY